MKILKILGVVAGLHALALLLIFANPGCSSAGAANAGDDAAAKPAAPPAPPTPAASVSVPPLVTASAVGDPAPGSALAAAPGDLSTAAAPAIRYSPTRPGTAVAAALEAQPVENVTPVSTYTVGRGDSLWTVAKKNHLTIAELCSANKLKPSASLHVGQKLILPAKSGSASRGAAASAPTVASAEAASAAHGAAPLPSAGKSADLAGSRVSGESERHIVKPGETLGAIARHYGVKVGVIATANSISDPKRIHPGQELIIPGKKASRPAALDSQAPPSQTLIVGPAPDQDLAAGVRPASSGEVPVIKVDDNPPAQPGKP